MMVKLTKKTFVMTGKAESLPLGYSCAKGLRSTPAGTLMTLSVMMRRHLRIRFYFMQASVKVLSIDSLQRKSGLVVAKLLEKNQPLLVEGRPMPKTLAAYVQDLTSRYLSF